MVLPHAARHRCLDCGLDTCLTNGRSIGLVEVAGNGSRSRCETMKLSVSILFIPTCIIMEHQQRP